VDAYDRCINLGKKNLADSVAIYAQGRELFRASTYCTGWFAIFVWVSPLVREQKQRYVKI